MTARLALLLLVVGLSAGVLLAGPATAADECTGLRVCLPVTGPWVVVPASGSVDYELACPLAGYVVAGTDARVATRDVDISFRAETGSPVGPGVTTRHSVVFHALRTRAGAGPTSFQPFVGCIPTSGGGGRALTGVAAGPASLKPTQPIRSVVLNTPIRAGTRTVRLGCPTSSRLAGSTHAVAFRRPEPPAGSMLVAVKVRRTVVDGVLVARITSTLVGTRAEVQLRTLCARTR